MKTALRIALVVYLLYSAICGYGAFRRPGMPAAFSVHAAVADIVAVTTFAAAVTAAFRPRLCAITTAVCQAPQIFGIVTPWLLYYYNAGLCLVVSLRFARGGKPMLPIVQADSGAHVGIALGTVHTPMSWYAFGVNFVPIIVVFVATYLAIKRPNQAPEPTPMAVTPPAAQEPRQP